MAFDFTAAIESARRVVHKTFSTEVDYTPPGPGAVPVRLSVRWHNRLLAQGNLIEGGYPDVLEGIELVKFDLHQLQCKGVQLQRTGLIDFRDQRMRGARLALEAKEPDVGPTDVIWRVVRVK